MPTEVEIEDATHAGTTTCRFFGETEDLLPKYAWFLTAPGQITMRGPIMNEGIGQLQFAGEHTCYQFVGYMEGGLHSGVDAAKRVLKRDRVQ